MSHAYSVRQSEEICKTLNALRLGNFLSDVYLEHAKTLIHSVFTLVYRGKIVNAEFFSEKHRTTVAHFLNNGRWDSLNFEKALKRQVIDRIYEESRKSGAPVFCIVDDTIASHTAPSSQAMHPIEAAYYHQSHLKKQQDYGHQAVGVMLPRNIIFCLRTLLLIFWIFIPICTMIWIFVLFVLKSQRIRMSVSLRIWTEILFLLKKSKRCITCDGELKPLFVISSTPLDCLISIQKRWSSLSKKSMQDWFCTISVRPLPLTLLFRANTANIHISLISQPLSIFADSSCWIAQCFLHPMLKLYSLSMCSLFAMDDTTLGKSKLVHLSASLTE